MDKVIIDDCQYLDKNNNLELPICRLGGLCFNKANDDCYYKQLQRAKAEIKELNKELEKHKSKIGHLLSPLTDSDFQDKLKELEQENAELKAECERLKDANFILRERTINYSEYKEKQYKQALQEIREYCGTCCHRFSENHKNLCFGCEYDKEVCDYSIILTKINSVIGAE